MKNLTQIHEGTQAINQNIQYMYSLIRQLNIKENDLVEFTDKYGYTLRGYFVCIRFRYSAYTENFNFLGCVKNIKKDGSPSKRGNSIINPVNVAKL